jgi:hypothetical protein
VITLIFKKRREENPNPIWRNASSKRQNMKKLDHAWMDEMHIESSFNGC